MSEETQAPDTVTPEAYQRVISERDEARKEAADLKGQLTASRVLNKAESHLRRQGIPEEELPNRMELLGPHLKDVSSDDVDTFLAEDRFKPLVTVNTPPTGSSGDGEPTPEPDGESPIPLGLGPSPAGDGAPPAQKKYTIRSPEVQELIRRNDDAGLKKLYDDGLIEPPVRNY